jgi:hypothetical protein
MVFDFRVPTGPAPAALPTVFPKPAHDLAVYFLAVLTGRRPSVNVAGLATQDGLRSFVQVGRGMPSRVRSARIARQSCPSRDVGEVVVLVDDGRFSQALTLTLRNTPRGWRLDDCRYHRARCAPRR